MAAPKTVWGIDIGQCALKALKLRSAEGRLQVEAFDIIEHPKILSQPDADRRALIRGAMEQFLARNTVAGSTIAISVPGQSSFTRFVKLPPVEARRIPEIVRFEAEQQIPFPINDVIWQWQTFRDPDSPDIEVGLFAMKQTDIAERLEHFDQVNLNVDIVQMAPLALYNFMIFDEQLAGEGATLLADVGADKTDLVVADGARIWTRTIQIGGNNFTEALVKAFKLSFTKAEKLKRTAATSKYARQIFQAMRPVFSDLVQEIQRSVGYYTSLHRETRFKKLLGLGNGFRLPGLQKFLEQNLNVSVARIDSYNKLTPSATVNAPTFTENVLSFATAYGLAIQGLGKTTVSTNLLPGEIVRQRIWSKKRSWFATAAAMIIVALLVPLARGYKDLAAMEPKPSASTRNIVRKLEGWRDQYIKLTDERRRAEQRIKSETRLFAYRDFWPSVLSLLSESIRTVAVDQDLLGKNPAALKKIERRRRRLIIVEKWECQYEEDISDLSAGDLLKSSGASRSYAKQPVAKKTGRRGFAIIITARTPLSRNQANELITLLLQNSVKLAAGSDYNKVLAIEDRDREFLAGPTESAAARDRGEYDAGYGTIMPPPRPSLGPERTPTGPERPMAPPAMPDPLFPDEDMSRDTRFKVCWLISISDKSDFTQSPAGEKKSGW